jgi:SNF2 family DNA or RNA helicase
LVDKFDKLEGMATGVDLVVADEAQYIKNFDTKRSRATRKMTRKAPRAVVMTGTPIENHPGEFVAILHALEHGISNVQGIVNKGTQFFKQVVERVYLRRNKEDVLHELPDLIEVEDHVELDASDLRRHLSLMEMGADFMHLRKQAVLGDGSGTKKTDRACEIIRDHIENGRLIVVFSFFLDVLRYLQGAFPDGEMICGAVSASTRLEMIDGFSKAKGRGGVLLSQIHAGGIGLNIQAASSVIIVEPQLNPAIEYQAISRVHRMGQRSNVTAYRLISLNTIEEGIVEMLNRKHTYMTEYARDSRLKEKSPDAISNDEMRDIVAARQLRLREALTSVESNAVA